MHKVLTWIDRHAAIFVVLGMLSTSGLGVLVLSQQGELHQTQRELATSARSQLVNRATNVESWCGGIDEQRRYDRRFVRQVTHGRVHYALPDKDCEALIRKTLESAHRAVAVTPTNHPLTYNVLHPHARKAHDLSQQASPSSGAQ